MHAVRLDTDHESGRRYPESGVKRVVHLLWHSQGGIRRHVRTVAQHPPCGWETTAVCGPATLGPYFAGVPFRAVSRAGMLRAGRDADLIHAHGVTAGIGALAPARPPLVLSLHVVVGSSGRTARSRFAARAAMFIASRADAVIAVSGRAAVGFGGARIVPPAFDPLPAPVRSREDVRAELGAAGDDVVAVAVSRLEREKRLELFVRAVEVAGCTGWIVGDGPERGHLTAAAAGTRTRLLGHRDDVSDILAAADLFALPSVSESYGIAVAEAIGCGLPVVATRTGAIDDIVGAAGVVVPPDDPESFVDAVVAITRDRDERSRLADVAACTLAPDRDTLIVALGTVYDDVVR